MPKHESNSIDKLPNALFKLLEVIGSHREEGLIQPDLTKESGQDKKSVPPRTTALKNMGYIEKISVLARHMNTSKLTLVKFAAQRDRRIQLLQAKKTTIDDDEDEEQGNEKWTGRTINTEELVKAILSLLKGAKNHVLMHGDMKIKLVSTRLISPVFLCNEIF